jgi:glucose-6-phosphate dehydrogenase assembly protein OpcA
MGATLTGGTLAPEKILRELAELWTSLSPHGEAGEGAGVLRASSMTLVVMAEETEDAAALGETIAALMPEHPARTIVVRLRGAGERMLNEHVSAQCWMPFGQRRQICCEQIEIVASDGALADLPSVVLPLAEPDLPLILWCRSPRILEMAEFAEIASMARKVILDSDERLGGGALSAKSALQWVTDHSKSGVLIGDLAWTRLTRWREMLSQIFQNRQHLSQLPAVTTVTVGVRGETPVSAWYYGAWVMGALQSLGVHPVLNIARDGEGASEVMRIELTGPGFRMELARWRKRMITTVNGLAQCVSLPESSSYLLMREELGITGRDNVFERTLETAVRLASVT